MVGGRLDFDEVASQVCLVLGITGIDAGQVLRVSRAFEKALQPRVGARLAQACTEAQLREFDYYLRRGDEEAASDWMDRNVPGYDLVVAEEVKNLIEDIMKRFSHRSNA